MFNKSLGKIIIIHNGNVNLCPPVINLVNALLNNGFRVHLISGNISLLKQEIRNNDHFSYYDLEDMTTSSNIFKKYSKRVRLFYLMRNEFKKAVTTSDIIWTTNESAVMYLNGLLKPYQSRHILQLMELIDYCPVFYKFQWIRFPIDKYARKAWKTVVPEINRAYIQQINWNLKELPYVLPNKPYDMNPGPLNDELDLAIKELENEKRKIILYTGIFSFDRDLQPFISAVERLKDEYCLFVIGRASGVMNEADSFENNDFFKYLGFFNPPSHLHLLKYAHIGLTPYKPSTGIKYASALNSLYCAPNKIFEYAGNGIPMIGTNVLGLKNPFEKFNIGICCNSLSPESIVSAIQRIEENYREMSNNCHEFYNSVDLDSIITSIIYD